MLVGRSVTDAQSYVRVSVCVVSTSQPEDDARGCEMGVDLVHLSDNVYEVQSVCYTPYTVLYNGMLKCDRGLYLSYDSDFFHFMYLS